jgi:hypothetical protein
MKLIWALPSIIFDQVYTEENTMQKNVVLIFFLSLIAPIPVNADGRYYVAKDAGGVYFQTDQDGGWYIYREDLKFFKIGDSGTYSIGKDVAGTYLSTDKNRKFYLDMEARAKLVKETEAFNAAQEKRLRDLKEAENKLRQDAKEKEDLDKGDKKAPQLVKVEVYLPNHADDEDNRSQFYMAPGYYPFRRPIVHPRPKDSLMPIMPPPDARPRAPYRGTGELPRWKGSPYR